jgi:two-component system cell cycle response regulator
LVTHLPETALRWRRELGTKMPDKMLMISREAALSEAAVSPVPDVFIIEYDLADPIGGLRLMSELRSRPQTRHAAICIVKTDQIRGESAIAFDLGANDVVPASVDPSEFSLRVARLLQRKRAADKLRKSVRAGLRMAVIDPLTGLFNRRYAVSQLAEIAAQSRVASQPFAVMVIDLDRFKEVNDQFGHAAGDAVLIEVAHRLATNIRHKDLLARIGGEEFLIALPCTDLKDAKPIAERLRKAVHDMPFPIPGFAPLTLTASIGLAVCDGQVCHADEPVSRVIDRADQALMVAKSGGRNQVTICKTAA